MSSCGSNESPPHTVTLTNDYFIGKTEVTQGEYEEMMDANPSIYRTCGADWEAAAGCGEHTLYAGSTEIGDVV